ncbi:conserved hypothetical protein [Roseobacter denitrificans OCh 114]|uniref:Uncharacterized protein n=1 Tax=Roseobacter denitrificans (strain ATCC 33942 / OCh 114) TaxID=375451 RepID=Q168Y8_ROSDO|nr:conserved hypothetical protein [Roseobacter denitrificans OCh 114]
MNSSCNCLRINGSSAENGSSINKTSGLAARARARPTRCCIPPDNSWANFAPHAPSSTISRIAAACRSRSFLATCRISRGIATLSRTDLCGINAKFWNTIPILRFRNACNSLDPRAITSVPSIAILPAVGSRRRLKWRTNVDLPLPDSPMMQKISPRETERETSATPTTELNSARTSDLESPLSRMACNAASGLAPKIFHTLEISITQSLICMLAPPAV